MEKCIFFPLLLLVFVKFQSDEEDDKTKSQNIQESVSVFNYFLYSQKKCWWHITIAFKESTMDKCAETKYYRHISKKNQGNT